VNKSGGPDRRFNDNRQIPIYRYGQVEIGCGSWRIRLCLSQANAAAEFATALQTAMSGRAPTAHADLAGAPPPGPPTPSTSLAPAFSALGLKAGASLEEASAAYKSLAAQSHPDKVAHMAPEFRELAERKMRELNAAYERIREFHKQC
jgi:DnaJ-domain-containing protein 1